ncbi:hypothetical protein [Corynebacterium hadale]|uniref:hypothetical protein n=1 Tax=Corynebacterium hadale TaxID=2026255 RepID=UPI001054DB22|nr:hypothetical protein [Corynebacterium hadale]
MSIYLLAVPKLQWRRDHEDIVGANNDVLTTALKAYIGMVGNHYDAEPTIKTPGQHGTVSIAVWKRSIESNRVVAKKDWWSHSSGQDVAEALLRSICRRGGKIAYSTPVWGSYTAIWGERYRDRVTLWNTIPALEAVHYTENQNYVFASNRPLLAELARVNGDTSGLALNQEFLEQYLMFGFTLDSNSPFEKVKILDVDQALEIDGGRLSLIGRPEGLVSSLPNLHTEADAVDHLSKALVDATHRSLSKFKGDNIQLRMSGGKDSRLLLGLTKKAGYPVYGVTFGKPDDEEVKVAGELCGAAETKLVVTAPKPVERPTLGAKVDRTILMSDGIPASEPHTSIYYGASPLVPGDAIVLGQWPLMKGGQAKKLNYSKEGIQRALNRQAAWFVDEGVRNMYGLFLDEWQRTERASSDLEFLYLFARNFRSGRWLQAHINLYERDSFIAYPIADEQVAAVSDAMTMTEKVSQRVLFQALEAVWPAAVRVPLSNGNNWRFERGEPADDLGSDSYQERHRDLTGIGNNGRMVVDPNLDKYKAVEYTRAIGSQMALELSRSENRELLFGLITPEFKQTLHSIAQGDFVIPEGSSQREILKFVWRLYVADRWLNKEWLSVGP